MGLVRPQHVIAGEFFTSPHGKPGSIINGIDRNHHVGIREQYLARHSCLGCRVDDGIIEQPLGLLCSQIVFCTTPMQSYVK